MDLVVTGLTLISTIKSFFSKKKNDQIIYQTDPAIIALIQSLKDQLNKPPIQCRSPKQFAKHEAKIKQLYLDSLTTMEFTSPLTQEQKSKRNVCLIGPTSVGKSTLWNNLFGLKLQVGVGSTTQEATMIKETNHVVYWDAPGITKAYGIYHVEHLAFFKSLNKVYVLFDSCVEDVEWIIRVLLALKVKCEYVRTKCDGWKSEMKPLKQELERDLKQIRQIDPSAKGVIAAGYGMYEEVSKMIKSE